MALILLPVLFTFTYCIFDASDRGISGSAPTRPADCRSVTAVEPSWLAFDADMLVPVSLLQHQACLHLVQLDTCMQIFCHVP